MQDNDYASAIYKVVGSRIAARRRSTLRITQAQLSALTGGRLSRSAIANIESGRQRVAVHHLYDLAAAMNCDPSELLAPTEEIVSLTATLVASVEGDPEATEFTRRILGLKELHEITSPFESRSRRK